MHHFNYSLKQIICAEDFSFPKIEGTFQGARFGPYAGNVLGLLFASCKHGPPSGKGKNKKKLCMICRGMCNESTLKFVESVQELEKVDRKR